MEQSRVAELRLVCDTNFLIRITSKPLPHFAEFVAAHGCEICTVSAVVRELDGLKHSKEVALSRRVTRARNLVGNVIHLMRVSCSPAAKEADEELFELAKSLGEGSFIATLDGRLLTRLEKNRLPYLTLRRDRPFLRRFARATYLSPGKE